MHAVRSCLFLVLVGCSVGVGTGVQNERSTEKQSEDSASTVWVKEDASLFRFDNRRGQLVFETFASEYCRLDTRAASGHVVCPYMGSNDVWVWVGSAGDGPLWVARADVHYRGGVSAALDVDFSDEHRTRALGTIDPVRRAQLGLFYQSALPHGSCPPLKLGTARRLEPSAGLQRSLFAHMFADYVLDDQFIFRSRHCLGALTSVPRNDAAVEPRDAYVLGAGDDPFLGERGMFLFLLAAKYRTIYVNDIQGLTTTAAQMPQQAVLYHQYACDAYPSFCERVQNVPNNFNFDYFEKPASDIPVPEAGVDVFVMFPSPEFAEPSWAAPSKETLSETLSKLLREHSSNAAYVLTELASEELHLRMDLVSVKTRLRAQTLFEDVSSSSHDIDAVTFWTLSGRHIEASGVLIDTHKELDLHVLQYNSWYSDPL